MSTQIDFEFNDEEKYVQRSVSCRYRCKGELQLKFLIDKVIGRPANKNFLQLSSIIYNSLVDDPARVLFSSLYYKFSK